MTDPITTPEQMREAALQIVERAADVRCAKCGATKNNHHYRHPFVPIAPVDIAAAIRAIPIAPQPDATPARDVRAAALREAAAEAAGEIAAHGYSEFSAFLRHRILALIDKEAAK